MWRSALVIFFGQIGAYKFSGISLGERKRLWIIDAMIISRKKLYWFHFHIFHKYFLAKQISVSVPSPKQPSRKQQHWIMINHRQHMKERCMLKETRNRTENKSWEIQLKSFIIMKMVQARRHYLFAWKLWNGEKSACTVIGQFN